MVVPIGDAPNPKGVPAVTYLLIAANVAVFALIALPLSGARPDPDDPALVEYVRVMTQALRGRVSTAQILSQASAYDLFVFAYGFRPAVPSLQDLFFSMFLHAGFLHLAGNMLFLSIYGDNVERRLGPVGYVLAYLAAGVAATLFHTLTSPGGEVPMIGASGAISGMLGFYFLWFPRNTVRLLWLLPPFFMQVFQVPARLVLGLYLVADNLLPFLIARSETGVAHGAHIGGFLAGLAAAWVLGRRALAAPPEYARTRAADAIGDGALRQAIADGRFAEAANDYFALTPAASRGRLSPGESLALARWLRENGHAEGALVVLRRLLREAPQAPEVVEAHILAGEILLEDLREPTPAYQHFQGALDLAPGPEPAARARHGLAAIEARQKRRIGTPHARRAG